MSKQVKDTNAVKYIKFLGNNTIPLQLLALRSYLDIRLLASPITKATELAMLKLNQI
jgi:hypothetical protein